MSARRIPLLIALLLPAAGLVARADEPSSKVGNHDIDGDEAPVDTSSRMALPIKPFARAREGDWVAYSCTGTPGAYCFITRVAHADRSTVTIAERTSRPDPEATLCTAPRQGAAVASEFFALLNGTVTNVRVTDDRLAIGGKAFRCKKLTCDFAYCGYVWRTTYWLSEDVRIFGWLAYDYVCVTNGMDYHYHGALCGYGHDERVEWGERPRELEGPPAPPPHGGP